MRIDRNKAMLASFSKNFNLGILCLPGVIPAVDQALAAHGKLEHQSKPLSNRLVFWLVIALALFRDLSVPNVLARLIVAGRSLFPGLSRKPVTDSALAHARQRLGCAPFETFFRLLAGQFTAGPWFHDWRPQALDGVHFSLPDTEKNCARFPRQITGRGRAAWPQMLAVCLVDIRQRYLTAANFGNIRKGERALAQVLWEHLREDDLLVEDKGFFKAEDFLKLQEANLHFLCKMPDCVKPQILQQNAPGDFLVELKGRRPRQPGEAPDHDQGRPGQTKKFKLVVRMLVYRVNQTEPRLATNVFFPAITVEEFTRVYHWRWDAEIAYDELKNQLMRVAQGQAKTVFRGKSPEMVIQEFWAMLTTYNLIRRQMAAAAVPGQGDPRKLSFTDSREVIIGNLGEVQIAKGLDLPRVHRRLLRDLAECRIDRPRRARQWPRVVKVKMSNFGVKHSRHRESKLVVKIDIPLTRKQIA